MERILSTFPYELGDLSPSNSGPRTWFDARASQGQPPPPPAALAEMAGMAASDRPDGVDAADRIRALFVNGPLSVARHVLATALVTLGRGPGVDIQVDAPCVSRVHARLTRGAAMAVTDLGSSNGTTVAGARLSAGVPRPLRVAEPFFIGRSALVIHVAPLARGTLRRLKSPGEVGAYLRAHAHAIFAILRITRPANTSAAVLETILGTVLGAVSRSPRDWASWLDPNRLLLGVEVPSPAEANLVERAAVRQLASWGVWAEIDAVNLPAPVARLADPELAAALAGHAQVSLKRGPVIVREPVMHELMRAARRVASADVGVLILGETGVGKDVVASLVHELSPRAERPFVGINCASVPEALLESELFGHERAAFTGAVTATPGLLEAADGDRAAGAPVPDRRPLPLQQRRVRRLGGGAGRREGARVAGQRARAAERRRTGGAAGNGPRDRTRASGPGAAGPDAHLDAPLSHAGAAGPRGRARRAGRPRRGHDRLRGESEPRG